MKVNFIYFIYLFTFLSIRAVAQDSTARANGFNDKINLNTLTEELDFLKRFNISGFLHAQYQWADSAGQHGYNGGNFPAETDQRFQLRRARFRLSYHHNWSEMVLQIDANETAVVTLKDAFVRLTEPRWKAISLQAGVFIRPFGFEVPQQTSALRESPERARVSQILLNGERDMGVMLSLAPPLQSRYKFIRVQAGLFNGTGQAVGAREYDSYKDFIGRISFNTSNKAENLLINMGVSYYTGGYRQDNDTSFSTSSGIGAEDEWVFSTGNQNSRTKRYYIGLDARVALESRFGITSLTAEYYYGKHPTTATNLQSQAFPAIENGIALPIYNRKVDGAILYFIQGIGRSPFQFVAKYDWFDPNLDIKGNRIGASGTGTNANDIRYDTFGTGINYRYLQIFRLTAYYEWVRNESTSLSAYSADLPDNLLTLRLQYQF